MEDRIWRKIKSATPKIINYCTVSCMHRSRANWCLLLMLSTSVQGPRNFKALRSERFLVFVQHHPATTLRQNTSSFCGMRLQSKALDRANAAFFLFYWKAWQPFKSVITDRKEESSELIHISLCIKIRVWICIVKIKNENIGHVRHGWSQP